MFDAFSRNKIDLRLEVLLESVLQIHVSIEIEWYLSFHQKVDIALRCFFPAGVGAEEIGAFYLECTENISNIRSKYCLIYRIGFIGAFDLYRCHGVGD